MNRSLIALAICAVAGVGHAQLHPQRYWYEAVVSDSAIASQIGADIMAKGGTAVDAAVAVGFALAVTHPAAGNLGGGGFMIVRRRSGETVALDFREIAPLSATKTMYIGPDGKVTKDSLVGYRAAGVPGTVAGLAEAHRRFGKLRWQELIEPAVLLANRGFKMPRGLADSLRENADLFKPFPAAYAQFCRNGRFYAEGENFRQPDLGRTLERIRDHGAKDFYEGETAGFIVKDMAAKGGLITAEDLKSYRVVARKPLVGTYRGYEVITMPPPSSGGIALLQMLGMVEGDDLKSLGWNSSATLHLAVEAMKRAFADRSEHLGDSDFVSVPVAQLLAPDYISRLRKSITDRALPAKEIKPWGKESEQTTHYSIIDGEGNAVSTTYTLNGSYGAGAVVEGAGFLLNNEMDDFAAQPGTPNLFGLIQGEKNSIQPGKRPLSSMTPTILAKDGKVVMVLGSPGGPTIINTVFQTIMNVVDHGMNIQRAVAAPRFHHQWMPDAIRWEPYGLGSDLRTAMEARGHVFEAQARTMGSCHAIWTTGQGNRQTGVDPRISTSGAAGR
ncbi:MAG: gamma-glutamyltransferase [Methanoregulaceae archaeon]|nr:gamma-glutamyltransferase [Methanoregulaceae archaeon]